MKNTLEEVRDYLERSRGQYGRLLAAIVGELGDVRDRARNHELVYRIYNRGDKQVGGDILKSDTSIARKLEKWRKEDGIYYSPCDIHDILGVTIVTYFDSGVDRVVSLLERVDAFRSFRYVKTEIKNRDDGYKAVHVIVAGRGVSRSKLRCEIQVKALLNDSWAAKTHDLTYKAHGRIDPRIKALVAEIGNQLQRVETQSQQLRDIIMFNDETDRQRREWAVKRLFLTASEALNTSDNALVSEMAERLLSRLDHYAQCHQDDADLVAFVDGMKELPQSGVAARATANIAMLLAASRHDRDLDEIAYDVVDHWVETADSDNQQIALGFKAHARWSLGDVDGAVSTIEHLLQVSEPARKARVRLDLAYYKAEQLFSGGADNDPDAISPILGLVRTLPKTSDIQSRMSMEDTKGAVIIMTAQNTHEVTRGLKYCEKAWKWAQENPGVTALFKDFYELHAERARRQFKILSA